MAKIAVFRAIFSKTLAWGEHARSEESVTGWVSGSSVAGHGAAFARLFGPRMANPRRPTDLCLGVPRPERECGSAPPGPVGPPGLSRNSPATERKW